MRRGAGGHDGQQLNTQPLDTRHFRAMTLANRRMRSDVCGLPTPHWTRRCWQRAPRSQMTPGSVLQAVHASRGKFITARPLDVSSKSKHLQNTLHLAPYESGSQKSHVSGAVHDILGHGFSATRTPLCVFWTPAWLKQIRRSPSLLLWHLRQCLYTPRSL